MAKVSSSTELPVPAKTVWDVIGNFNALPDWHPAVAKSEIKKEGGSTLRKLSLVGGGSIEEKLEQIDDKERLYTYSILREGDKGCTVEWSSEFEAKGAPENAATAAISGIYEAGFENLKKMFGG